MKRGLWKITGVALLLLPLLLLMGNCPNCDRREPTLACETDIAVFVLPGECVPIDNPCDPDGEWYPMDGFSLCPEPDAIFVRTRRNRTGVTRELCASSEVADMGNVPVAFLYSEQRRGLGRPEIGEGVFLITTGNAVVVSASANPGVILAGETTQLDAAVSGGTPPYTFLWSSNPPGAIAAGDETLQNPVATPAVTSSFTVVVTDSRGLTGADTVDVEVGLGLMVSASPSTINVGESSQLQATVVGGLPPYVASWVPVASLSDPTILDPVASPVNTTAYTVTIDDAAGNHLEASVTVTVNMEITVTATPQTINQGDSSQLNVSVAGGLGPYTYQWDPADGLNPADATLPNPVVNPSMDTTYRVTVVGADTQSVVGTVAVTVIPAAPSLTACFTVTPDPPDMWGDPEIWDAGCSTGAVTGYRWVFAVVEWPGVFDICYGAGTVIDWDIPYAYDTSCASFDFDPNIVQLPKPFEGPPDLTWEVTLYVTDGTNTVSTSRQYAP